MTARGNSRGLDKRGRHLALCAGVAMCALLSAGSASRAQEPLGQLGASVTVPDDAQLFLESDTVAYDSEKAVVTADGGVQIDYGGYKLVARRVVYNQKTRRLIASGDVELQQPDGNKIYADSADITDDFGDGFINALRIETPDNTRFAARGAVRENGTVTSFEQGVYTACEACEENPERAPLWQVKARKIVWDQQEKVIRYYGARFELFGAPIAYLPYFQSADPTVKRKSGFLVPTYSNSEQLGFGLRVPYFFALADDKDITVTSTYYTRQGFLGEVEYRQATSNGFFTLKAAGISQKDIDAFADEPPFATDPVTGVPVGSLSPDFLNTDRGMIGTTGRFDLSDRWVFGWDILAQSDQNFSNTYGIEGFSAPLHTSEVYLTGLGDRSYFDLRAQRFDYQSDFEINQDVQPEILPSLDYERIEDEVFGGEVEIDVNVTNLSRDDTTDSTILLCEPQFIVNGGCSGQAAFDQGRASAFPHRYDFFDRAMLEGDYTRASTNAEWRKTITTEQGLLLTPSLGLRGDVYRADMGIDSYDFFPTDPNLPVSATNPLISLGGVDVDQSGFRGMATAGIEARYPILFETATTSHVVEPIGQLLLRPDEMEAGNLPNEDAQGLVFNTTNLFDKDKFSGYDRIEGGSRANVGLRYAGTFETGYTLDAMVGQSYALGGQNSYSEVDLALVGFDSGLETDVSDYVASATLGTQVGLEFGVSGRFDEESLAVRRSDVYGNYGTARGSVSVVYSFIGAQEIYGFPLDRSQVSTSASLKLTENWTAYGSVGYDVENSTLISRAFGIGYLDECFSLLATYSSTEDNYQINEAENKVMFTFGLRTIADFQYDYDLNGDE